jgi:hypothetical protein
MLDPNICAACWGMNIPMINGTWLCCLGVSVGTTFAPPVGCYKLFEQSVAAGVSSVNIDTKVTPAGGEDT